MSEINMQQIYCIIQDVKQTEILKIKYKEYKLLFYQVHWIASLSKKICPNCNPPVPATDDRSKVQCCKEQYCIGTWNFRSMNQSKLDVVKQMCQSEHWNFRNQGLKWTGMGEFNSDDHCIYYCGQESLRRNGVAIIVNKKSQKCSTWMQSQKQQNDLCSFPSQTIQYHSNPSLCPNQ